MNMNISRIESYCLEIQGTRITLTPDELDALEAAIVAARESAPSGSIVGQVLRQPRWCDLPEGVKWMQQVDENGEESEHSSYPWLYLSEDGSTCSWERRKSLDDNDNVPVPRSTDDIFSSHEPRNLIIRETW